MESMEERLDGTLKHNPPLSGKNDFSFQKEQVCLCFEGGGKGRVAPCSMIVMRDDQPEIPGYSSNTAEYALVGFSNLESQSLGLLQASQAKRE